MTAKKSQDNETTTQKPTCSASSLATKKATVLGSTPASGPGAGSRKIVLATCIVVLFAVFSVILLFSHSGTKDKTVELTPVAPVDGELVHAASLFTDGQARHFVLHTQDGTAIRYFVLRTDDGQFRTAFDACDACWQADMGYVQDGDVMICRNCNMRFPSRVIGEVRGGCNPSPLPSLVRGESLVIRKSDILEGRRYFDFGTGSARG